MGRGSEVGDDRLSKVTTPALLYIKTHLLQLFFGLCAQMSTQRAVPLLLSLLCVRASVEECAIAIMGQSVSLPCYPELLNLINFSIEWRRVDEVVFRSVWEGGRVVETWSINSTKISADAALTGNFSLELPAVDPTEDRVDYSLVIISEENQSAPACTVCLRTAASFSFPLLQRQEAAGEETAFLCQSNGGYPQPAVHWLIDDTEEPPEGSVRTLIASQPHSHLYNITSHLTVNISEESSVSCVVENLFMNQTLTSVSYGVQRSPVVRRATEAMWMFSTALCVVVGVMVMVGVAYQIHLDRISRRRKQEYQQPKRGYRRRQPYMEVSEEINLQPRETDA